MLNETATIHNAEHKCEIFRVEIFPPFFWGIVSSHYAAIVLSIFIGPFFIPLPSSGKLQCEEQWGLVWLEKLAKPFLKMLFNKLLFIFLKFPDNNKCCKTCEYCKHKPEERSIKFFSGGEKAELLFLLSTTIALNREKCFAAHTTQNEKRNVPIVCTQRGSENGEREREMRDFDFREKLKILRIHLKSGFEFDLNAKPFFRERTSFPSTFYLSFAIFWMETFEIKPWKIVAKRDITTVADDSAQFPLFCYLWRWILNKNKKKKQKITKPNCLCISVGGVYSAHFIL